MSLYDKAFWWSVFFLVGVFVASFGGSPGVAVGVGICVTLFAFGILFFLHEKKIAIATIAILLGCAFASIYSTYTLRQVHIPFSKQITAQGVVRDALSGADGNQNVTLSLNDPYRGSLRLTLPRYPEYAYGNVLEVSGVPRRVEGAYGLRLLKDGIHGTMKFPKTELRGVHGGSRIVEGLMQLKRFSLEKIRNVLPLEKAAFLSGILLGETSEFTKEFKEKLQRTGTSHLVALSGYNIAIVANSALVAFGLWLGRRKAIIASAGVIIAFVVMTGAEASVVRASMMAGIVLLAESSRRIYSFRNAIVVAALLMVLANPRVLVWDLGFQLSFAAIIGIVYVKPALMSFFNAKPTTAFLGIAEHFWSTLAAELAVFPILMMSIGTAPVLGIITNVLVLGAIPLGMAGGFALIIATSFSYVDRKSVV